MKTIPCKACTHIPMEQGCHTCGGYKIVLMQSHCATCPTKYWERPGCYTVYDGKEVRSVDGLELVYRAEGLICKKCDQQRNLDEV